MSLSSLITSLEAQFHQAGIESPRAEAEILAGHVLGMSRSGLYLEGEREITGAHEARIRELAARRLERYPLQYITGECEFMSLCFGLQEGVFIPRPETEVLVESVIERIHAAERKPRSLLEIGTGCGVIGISLACAICEWPGDRREGVDGKKGGGYEADTGPGIVATDISRLAIETARANARSHGVENLMQFIVGDGISFLRKGNRDGGGLHTGGGFDVFVCNPPYIAASEIEGLERDVRDHEPRAALDGGEDGLDFLRRTIPALPSILSEGALAAFEIGAGQGEAVSQMLGRAGAPDVEIIKDLSGRDRVVSARMA